MDKKLEARIARLEKLIRNKRLNEEFEDDFEMTPEDYMKVKAFTREMTMLLDKYNAVIEVSPDGGVWAIENEPDGMILMNF